MDFPKVCFFFMIWMSLTNIQRFIFGDISVAWDLTNASFSSFLLHCDSNGLLLKSDHCNSGCHTRSYSHLLRPHVSTSMLCYFCWPLLQLHLLMFTITLNLSDYVLSLFPPYVKKELSLLCLWWTKKNHQSLTAFIWTSFTPLSFPFPFLSAF